MQRRNVTAVLLPLVAVMAGACGYAAPAEEGGNEPGKVESVEDSDLSRVVLTADAAKRIGLETARVTVSRVEGDTVVRGRVAADPGGPSGSLLVHVSLPATQLTQVDLRKPARVLEVFGQDGLVAPLVREAPAGGTLTYRLDGAAQVVHPGSRVRVDLPTAAGTRKTIPYSAVIYGVEGGTWTYTAVGPLTFVRAPIAVASLQGGMAVLEKGPPRGTEVVTVGGEELLGTEFAIEGE
ncbi:MAG TPA: hypothetical protein VE777_02055 [Gaiellales bacterium]|jgi:hypothetical protein|nr:hypothetical protein [Gaiellales bacterium]